MADEDRKNGVPKVGNTWQDEQIYCPKFKGNGQVSPWVFPLAAFWEKVVCNELMPALIGRKMPACGAICLHIEIRRRYFQNGKEPEKTKGDVNANDNRKERNASE